MKRLGSCRSVFVLGMLALTWLWSPPADAQVRKGGSSPRTIPSLTERGEALVIKDVSPQTGFVTFASSAGGGILLPLEATISAEARALRFVDDYGKAFGLQSASQVRPLRAPETDERGFEHVRLQQFHQGVPVRGGDFIVHLRGARVMAANGHILDDLPESVIPAVDAASARAAARQLMEKHRSAHAAGADYSEPRLEIFNRALLSDNVNYRSRLAWFVEARGRLLREYIWIDAQSRAVLLNFSQLTEAKNRQVYDAQHRYTLPGTLVRSEGGAATGDTDEDNAYTYAGITYDYYFNNHGRDSYNNAGATLKSSAHYCPEDYPQGSTCPGYRNAFWSGLQMVYADGFASADDVVGHELTHAVTESSADLFYYVQSGALNESFSDIFGETIDLLDGVGNDTSGVRWRIGEDLSIGAIRDMMNPNNYSDPGKMSDSGYFVCSSSAATDDSDGGGVHENSGIPNHAYALMVDGGTYNNTTITGIGLTKAAKIEYRALTLYLTSGATFMDDYNALNQACSDLIGTASITSADCTQVTKALQAVEMHLTWPCWGAVAAPPRCSTGTPLYTFLDAFESVSTNWSVTGSYGTWFPHDTGFAKGGTYMAYGEDPDGTSDHRLTQVSPVVIPAGGRLYFDHAFEFENDWLATYDGGVIEYSTNNGSTWNDAGSLIETGQAYNGTIDNGPLDGRAGFVASSYGYTGTRLNLSSLAGQSVKFRFRISSDISVSSLGWVVDNVAVYTCTSVPVGPFTVVDSIGGFGKVSVDSETSTYVGDSGVVLTDVAQTSTGAMYGVDYDNLYSINRTTGAATWIGALGVTGMNALVGNGTGLLAASNDTTSLYSVNTSTGAATALTGSLGYPSMGDLAFHGGFLYAAVQNGGFSDLVRITLSGSSFTATNLGHVTADNALFGLADGTDKNLYGFTGTSVIRINTTNPAASTVVVANYAANGSGLDTANGASAPVPVPFTNDTLTPLSSIIRAVHITELRTRINAVRAAVGLGAYSWTDPTLTPQSTKARAVHVSDLRTALSQAYTAAGRTPPTFTVGSLGATKIRAVQIQELRAAVAAME